MAEKYILYGLLIFSWSDTCWDWERGIWRTDIFWFC